MFLQKYNQHYQIDSNESHYEVENKLLIEYNYIYYPE